MVTTSTNTPEFRRRVYWITSALAVIFLIKYGSKYAYFVAHHRECLVDYLKKSNFSQKIENVGSYQGSESLCNLFIEGTIDFHRNFRLENLGNDMDKKMTKCIENRYDKSDIKLDFSYIAYLSLIANETKTNGEEHIRLINSAVQVETLKFNFFSYDCILESHLSSNFEKLCDSYEMFTENNLPIAQKCFADFFMYHSNYSYLAEKYLNLPEVPAIICAGEIIPSLKANITNLFYLEQSLKFFKDAPKFRECFIETVVDTMIIDNMVMISMLSVLKMDEKTKINEFKKYSDLFEKFKKILYNECIKKHEYS